MKEVYLDFRGDIRSLITNGATLSFGTVHPDGQTLPGYALDADKGVLSTTDRPADPPYEGQTLTLGKKTFELPAAISAFAMDASGKWAVAGCSDGTVAVFHAAKSAFEPLESAKLHRGEVTALAWETSEPRFWSAGADNQLLSTHAKGALEAIDRAGKNGHDAPVRALVLHDDLLLSAGDDSVLKLWERGSRRRPSSVKSAGKATGLVVVTLDSVPTIALATETQIRLFPLEKGKAEALSKIFHGALAKVKRELAADPTRRKAALDILASWDDTVAIELLATSAKSDSDHKLRVHAVGCLAKSVHPGSIGPLEGMLSDALPALRIPAYDALVRRVEGLRPLELALASGHPDLGERAVAALAANKSDMAHDRLLGALDHGQSSVRAAVLEAFEAQHPKGPEASMLALRSRNAELRQLAAIRLHQRSLLQDPQVARALRTLGEDDDSTMRHTAYTLRVMAWPNLAAQLAYADSDLARAIHAVETFGQEKPGKPGKPSKPKAAPETLSPLVQAASSRKADTSLRGAAHLAALGDARALGVLLQLSRHATVEIRRQAAKALASLGDDKALSRLRAMLRDGDRSVRDAAFSALSKLLTKTPLDAVEAGFLAPEVDVRARALALLVKNLAKAKERGRTLLMAALNDADSKQQSNAFKAAVTLGEPTEALSFVLQSLRPAVRRLALTEIMAEVQTEWAYALLLTCFDDPDATLRKDALAFARKKAKGRKPSSTLAALRCKHADLRLDAVEVLSKKVDAAAASHLAEALDDTEAKIRLSALAALQRANASEAIVSALDSVHDDVRIGAASTLAAQGDARALSPLLDQIRAEEPKVGDLQKRWEANVRSALQGLSRLGDPSASDDVVELLAHDALRSESAMTLCWIAEVPTLRAHLKGPEDVAALLSLGLAWRGHADGAALVFEGQHAPADLCAAALALKDDERLLALLEKKKARSTALQVLTLASWSDPSFPDLLLSALPSSKAEIRLAAASLLGAWNEPPALQTVVEETLHVDKLPLAKGLLRRIAIAVRHSDGLARVAVVRFLGELQKRFSTPAEAKQVAEGVAHSWSVLTTRFPELSALKDPGAQAAADLQPIVYGTLVALSGQVERGGEKVRARALRRLGALSTGEALHDAVLPALQDPHTRVRQVAFELLADTDFIVDEALATGHDDLGTLALQKLSEKGGTDVLLKVMTERNDRLAWVAWSQFCKVAKGVAGIAEGLEARNERVRGLAVSRADEHWDKQPKLLRGCLKSSFSDVVREAAFSLGMHKEPTARPVLFELLRNDEHAYEALESLGMYDDPEVADGLLDRLEHPLGDLDADDLIDAVGDMRRIEVADRLVKLAAVKKHARDAQKALLKISGYDQRLVWNPERPDDDTSWMKNQHPRHDAVLAQVLDLAASRTDRSALRRLWRGAAWAAGETDGPLVRMLDHADEAIRHGAAETYGTRVRFRNASPDPLKGALAHKDGSTAFYAAEGLARASQADGISVLLASVDTLSDLKLRHRAVLALGMLADDRVLEPLMAIAADAEHALVESAAEALGHLSGHADADKVLARLLALSKLDNNVGMRALTGLRWFGSPTAWARIREQSHSPDDQIRRRVGELLQFDPVAANTDLRRLLLEDDAYHVRRAASAAWRLKVGEDSMEPDYAIALTSDLEEDTIERLRTQGEPESLLGVLADPRCNEEISTALLLTLMTKKLPSKSLLSALASPLESAVIVAARLLGRQDKLAAPEKQALLARAKDVRVPPSEEGLTAYALGPLWWACARHGLIEPIQAQLDHVDPAVRRAAAAAARASADAGLAEHVVGSSHAGDRTLAARTLPVKSKKIQDLLDDPTAADAVLARGASVPADQVLSSHSQGVVLPHLVRTADTKPFGAALKSPVQNVRLGALEALGRMGAAAGEKLLESFAKDDGQADEERKHAWRCLRRSKRVRETAK